MTTTAVEKPLGPRELEILKKCMALGKRSFSRFK